jgi:hypothetical protein
MLAASSERGFDRPSGGDRVFGATDGPADDKNAGALVTRLPGSDDTLLVARRTFGQPQARHDEEAVLPLTADCGNFLT